MKFKHIFKKTPASAPAAVDREYKLGEYKIILKHNHMLDKYQSLFPLYDKFLPLLCSDFKGLIVDIGANIGDTSIAIFSKNKSSFIVGVEPDDTFYNECIANITINNLNSRFLAVNKFVSTTHGKFIVDKNTTSSTGSMSKGELGAGESNTISFSELMTLIPEEEKQAFELIKIDTDGFDWDIINSFSEYALNHRLKPRFVFLEMQTFLNNDESKTINRDECANKYGTSLQKLFEAGYNLFCLFDNFGTHIKTTGSIDEILEINRYLTRSQVHNHHSSIHYLDILAFSESESNYVNQKLEVLYL
jgi:FkbM family methyltransferase